MLPDCDCTLLVVIRLVKADVANSEFVDSLLVDILSLLILSEL